MVQFRLVNIAHLSIRTGFWLTSTDQPIA